MYIQWDNYVYAFAMEIDVQFALAFVPGVGLTNPSKWVTQIKQLQQHMETLGFAPLTVVQMLVNMGVPSQYLVH